MPARLAAFWAAMTGQGSAPKAVRIILAVAGVGVLCLTAAVFWMKAVEADLSDDLMVWTGMFILLGLVMIWTAGRQNK